MLQICHHLPERSHLFGLDLPLCCRCTGIYVFLVLGFVAGEVRHVCRTRDSRYLLFVLIPLSLTAALQAGMERFLGLDMGNAVRFVSGAIAGGAIGILLNTGYAAIRGERGDSFSLLFSRRWQVMRNRQLFGILAVCILAAYALACSGDKAPSFGGTKSKGGGSSGGANISASCYWQPHGNTVVVTVKMKNTGTKTANGIKISVKSPGSLFASSLSHESLAPGKSAHPHIEFQSKPRSKGKIVATISGSNFSTVTASTDYNP